MTRIRSITVAPAELIADDGDVWLVDADQAMAQPAANGSDAILIPADFGSVDIFEPVDLGDQKPLVDMIDPSVNALAEARAAGQWYLDNTTPGGLDLNVAEVWQDYTGRGVVVAVYDQGIEASHHDLDVNYVAGWELAGNDAAPEAGDNHGTAVAGIIAAESDGTGTVGVAFRATIVSVDYDEVYLDVVRQGALMNEMDRYDVVNCSWSNYEPFLETIGGLSWAGGLFDAVENGRDGLGTVVVKAGGNARIQRTDTAGTIANVLKDDGNTSLFTNSRYTLDVANVDANGNIATDSTPGANLLVSAFGMNIVTTDRIGMNGYNTGPTTPPPGGGLGGDYTTFSGTSAAAPIVSGIVALMLEANPNLGWRDVQTILANSAQHVGSAVGAAPNAPELYSWTYNQADTWNGGGMHFSNDYGFGLVDARAAVRLSESWTVQSTSANEARAGGAWIGTANITEALPGEGQPNRFELNVTQNIMIESLDINLGVAHSRMSDLEVRVRSPEGTWSTLLNQAGVGGIDISLMRTPGWTLSSNAFRGEMSQGQWWVEVVDRANDPANPGADNGTITNVFLTAFGSDNTADDTYIYTDEFGETNADAQNDHGDSSRSRLSDTDGGTDTINAAAVSSNVILDLNPNGLSWIGWGAFQIQPGTEIESAFGGDGRDQIFGNDLSNQLRGNRGDDFLVGKGEYDILLGGAGDDVLAGGAAGDTLDGGEGFDFASYHDAAAGVTVSLADDTRGTGDAYYDMFVGIEGVIGSAHADILYGDGNTNELRGGDGTDTLTGGGGFDTLRGGNDGDHYYLLDATEYDSGNGILVDRFDAVEETGGGGIDTVWVSSEVPSRFLSSGLITSYTLPDNVEMGVVEGDRPFNITGNDLDNKFYGNPAANTFDGDLGNDVVDYVLSEAGVEVLLADQALNGGGALGDRFISIEGVAGTRFSDQLRGDANSNNLWGYGDSDVLDGGEGNDGMDGGEGSDTFVVDNGTAIGGDVAIGGDGEDEVWADESVAATGLRLNLFAEGTLITAAVNLVPNTSAAIDVEWVHGGAGNDVIDASRLVRESVGVEGLAGDDTFFSGGSADFFDGGADTDTIAYAAAASNYVITAGDPGSNELVIEDLTTGYLDFVHDVELVRFNGVTTALAATSRIVGTEGADVLVGDAANNIMDGRGGDDVMTGGAGADSFVGGAGRDLMYVDAQDTSIQGGDGFDIVYADAGTAATGLRFAHAGTGVEAAFGGAGNDVLDASGAAIYDNMSFGGAGNDVLIASSAGNYTMQGGSGIDTAVFVGNQSDYTIDGGTPIGWPSWLRVTNNATGNVSWLQTVERLQFADRTIDAPGLLPTALGTAGADVINAAADGQVIHGLAGDDRLTGGSGEDVLDGGAGADRMSGGAGNDSFFIDNSDTLVDGGEGYDSIYVDDSQGRPGSVRFALAGTNVEFAYGGVGNDIFDASGVSGMVELWGQWGDDVLTGGSGDDTLLGDEWLPGGGNDVLDGGAGNDWLDGGNGNDTFLFRLGSGIDTVGDFGQAGDQDVIRIAGGPFASFAALAASGAMVQSGANVVITLSASDQITLRNVQLGTLDGSDFLFTNQVINGTSNAETLSGQGSDTIHGFGGNDLILGTGNAGVAFGDDGGDQLYFQGDQNQLSGGEGNDWLGVNGNNNALMGGAGDESWIGASGNGNTLAGGDGGDALFANGTGNYLHGETGNDWLGVSGSQNRLFGGAGSEWMGASGNGNLLFGGEGGDTLFSVGANVLYGETGDDWIGCSGNGNVLNGAQGNDYLAASGNNNTLDGGAGNDVLVAGGAHGGDRFVFHVGYGMDTVVNFSRHGAGGSDVVDLNGFGLNFSSLQGYMADVGGNCVITLDAATSLTIDGISKGHLLASDFLF